jgi:hypothetical protein
MSLTIVSAIIVGATTLCCCPFIRGYYQTNENQQSEKITADLVDGKRQTVNSYFASSTLQIILDKIVGRFRNNLFVIKRSK